MSSQKKTRMVSLRLTEEQYQYLDRMSAKIRRATGFKITRASIILKLMEYGLPFLEQEFPEQEQEEPKKAPTFLD